MSSSTSRAVFDVPAGTESYASELTDLRPEDIPWDRVAQLNALMEADNEIIALDAACVLCSWGLDVGLEYLQRFVAREPIQANWHPHRLRLYDQTFERILDAFVLYWISQSENGNDGGARHSIFLSVSRITELANSMPFEVHGCLRLLDTHGLTEYLPVLKKHLEALVSAPHANPWKLKDCAATLMKFDPDFVRQQFVRHGLNIVEYLE